MAEADDLIDQFSFHLTREQKMALVPFFSTWLIYFVLYMPIWGYPPETLGSVYFKVLPILCLCYYVAVAAKDFAGGLPSKDELIPTEYRASHFQLALLFSCLGDAFLVWRQTLFIPGLLAFAVAQALYFKGLEQDIKTSRTKSLFVLLGSCIFMFLKSGIDSYILIGLVAGYIALIFAMGWRAVARYESEGSKAAFAGCLGAMLFILSDFIIAVDKWCFTVPCAASLIMSSYYIAQLCLALSTTKDLQ